MSAKKSNKKGRNLKLDLGWLKLKVSVSTSDPELRKLLDELPNTVRKNLEVLSMHLNELGRFWEELKKETGKQEKDEASKTEQKSGKDSRTAAFEKFSNLFSDILGTATEEDKEGDHQVRGGKKPAPEKQDNKNQNEKTSEDSPDLLGRFKL